MTDAPSEEELVTIEKYVDDVAADALRSQVVALVAALRSDRRTKERNQVAIRLQAAELERERTQNRELRDALKMMMRETNAGVEPARSRLENARTLARAALSTQEAQA